MKKRNKKLMEFGPTIIVPTMPWVGRSGLDDAVVESIQASLFSLTDPKILGAIGGRLTGFRKGADERYDGLRRDMKELDKLVKEQSPSAPAVR